jgi:hypothetical protein
LPERLIVIIAQRGADRRRVGSAHALFERDQGVSRRGGCHLKNNSPGLIRVLEPDLSSPDQRADLAIGVDPECVAAHRELFGDSSRALDQGARSDAGQHRRELRVIGVEVLQKDLHVGSDRVRLLIGGR